jgi:hypothetical protein
MTSPSSYTIKELPHPPGCDPSIPRFGVVDEDGDPVPDEESPYPVYLIFDSREKAEAARLKLVFSELSPEERRLICCALHQAKHSWADRGDRGPWKDQAAEAASLEAKLLGDEDDEEDEPADGNSRA